MLLQAQLEIGSTDDPLEREADDVAGGLLRTAAPGATKKDRSIRPMPPPAVAAIQCKCGPCEKEDQAKEIVRRKATDAYPTPVVTRTPAGVLEVLSASGAPLDVATRTFMEPRFGQDFSRVRVHADAAAARSAAAMGAAAYTVGSHIAFAAGRYAPGNDPGRMLLAHELAHVVQQGVDKGPIRRQPAAATSCAKTYTKASSFKELIDLVKAAEAKLAAAGITTPKDQIHALRGIFYGTTWSLDYSVERSTTRNEGFQRFTRPSQGPAASVPPDVRAALDCGLYAALQGSQDLVDPSGRQVDLGHLIIGLDARNDPALSSNVQFPVKIGFMHKNIDMGGTGTQLVTWLGDLGGGAASLAIKRVTAPTTSASTVFTGTDYGGSINLEGDVAGSVVATGSPRAVTAPSFASGKGLSDALQDYLSPTAAGTAWNNRATTFLTMNGATFDASNALTNRAALVAAFAARIQDFACNYLASRVKDKHVTAAAAKVAATHVVGSSQEVAAAFVDALDDSHKSGGKIEATRFPAPTAAGSSACTIQLLAAQVLGL